MGRITIKQEKGKRFFSVTTYCYVNDYMIFTLKDGEEKSYDLNDESVELKCFVPRGPMSEIYKLDMRHKDEVKITVKATSNIVEIEISDFDAVISIMESKQPNLGMYEADIKTICDITKVSKTKAENEYVMRAFNLDKTVEALGGPNNIAEQIKNGPKPRVFMATKAVGELFGINERTQQWAVGRGFVPSLKNAIPHEYKDIIDYELLEDGTSVVKGGLGRAAVGGMLFGGVGAIVGGVTGGKKAHGKCTNLTIKITIDNMDNPVEYIKLISSPIDKNSFTYKSAFRNAQDILSLLQIICSQYEKENISRGTALNNTAAEEIRKYKALMDEGIITKEEFDIKKKQLLNI